jgi:hypothetical protein
MSTVPHEFISLYIVAIFNVKFYKTVPPTVKGSGGELQEEEKMVN